METIRVDRRFRGPLHSANGGYFAGLVAAAAGELVRVRIHRPPPLEVAMTLCRDEERRLLVLHGAIEIAEAWPATLSLELPDAPGYVEALGLALQHPAYDAHPNRECFVCGTARARGDGLRIHAGRRGDGTVAAAWIPEAALGGPDGKLRPPFLWAALDCPGYFAASPDARSMLLGEFTAHADRLPHVEEPCVVIGWRLHTSGRRHEVGTALFDGDGEPCAQARALWIEPRSAPASS